MKIPFVMRSVAAGCALILVALMTACATRDKGATPAAAPIEMRDRMTASDEPDAVRRGRARMDLAAAYFGRGQMTTALDQIKQSIAADPTSSEAFNLRGMIYSNLNEPVLAEESFRRALQLAPRDADTMQNLAWLILCQQKRYPEADAMFERALAVPNYPNAPRTLLTQGVCRAFSGKLSEAAVALGRSYELDPGNPGTAVNLSEVLYRLGDYERARFYIRRVNVQPDVSSAQTLWLATRIEHRLGNRQGTEEFGSQLRNRFPESREASSYQRGAFDE